VHSVKSWVELKPWVGVLARQEKALR
jgi:hypothetical protein